MKRKKSFKALALNLIPVLLFMSASHAAENDIRKNLGAQWKELGEVDRVSQTPMPGIWEVKIGSLIVYTDPMGKYLLNGTMVDVQTKRNLTQDRINSDGALDFSVLPLEDSFISHREGNGDRKIAVFTDPNCGYCKKFEFDLAKLSNVTVYPKGLISSAFRPGI
jgi:thiol:disulfide interchange protein DsbC